MDQNNGDACYHSMHVKNVAHLIVIPFNLPLRFSVWSLQFPCHTTLINVSRSNDPLAVSIYILVLCMATLRWNYLDTFVTHSKRMHNSANTFGMSIDFRARVIKYVDRFISYTTICYSYVSPVTYTYKRLQFKFHTCKMYIFLPRFAYPCLHFLRIQMQCTMHSAIVAAYRVATWINSK